MKTTALLLLSAFLLTGSLKVINPDKKENGNDVFSSGYDLNTSSPLYYMATMSYSEGPSSNILIVSSSKKSFTAVNTLERLSFEVGAYVEPAREIEQWMSDPAAWIEKEAAPALPVEFEEAAPEVENWMVNPSMWNEPAAPAGVDAEKINEAMNAAAGSASEFDPGIESWMVNPSMWNEPSAPARVDAEKINEAIKVAGSMQYAGGSAEFNPGIESWMVEPFSEKWEDSPIESWMSDPKSWIKH
jgi:hypothetical protein